VLLPNGEDKWIGLAKGVIPNVVAVLIGIPVVYLLFTRKGITVGEQITAHELEELIVRHIGAKAAHPQVLSFYNSFRDVPWKEMIPTAQTTLEIVVNYWDSWASDNHERLAEFFKKRSAKMRVFVPDPANAMLVTELLRLYPDKNADLIRDKIMKTGDNLRQALKDGGGTASQLEFYYVPHSLNYALQVIDRRVLVLSNYDMFRRNRIGAPAIVLDLGKSEHLANYWNNELDGLLKCSAKVNPSLDSQKERMQGTKRG
jgi:hypothetical protein